MINNVRRGKSVEKINKQIIDILDGNFKNTSKSRLYDEQTNKIERQSATPVPRGLFLSYCRERHHLTISQRGRQQM
jgi:hypothetical protein